jgi:hypothetical protein
MSSTNERQGKSIMNRVIAVARLGVFGLIAASSLTLSPVLTMTGEAHEGNGMADEDYAAGEPGDAKQAARTVEITMRDVDGKLRFEPASVEVTQGEQIKFILHNGALSIMSLSSRPRPKTWSTPR